MLQDIQNFSDITAINTKNNLKVIIEYKVHKSNDFTFLVNDIVCKECNTEIYFDLLKPIKFECLVYNGAIEVINLTINNYKILPLYQHLCVPQTSWITDSWYLHIPQPFYPWYHQVTGQGWIA